MVYGLPPEQLIAANDGDAAALKALEDELLGRGIKKGSGHASMGQDIRKKRRTEIDYINGFVARKGAELGIEAPANAAITELVAMERGEVQQGPDAIVAMVKRLG